MLPELFEIGGFPVRVFGLMMALSFLAGVLYVRSQTARLRRPFEPYLNVAYLLIFAGVFGARLGYVVLHWPEFENDLLAIINPFQSGQFGIAGLNLYGGVLLAIGAAVWYCRAQKLSVLDVFDLFAPTLALGIGISRIGCFANGCCFGTPTELPWGVQFPAGSLPDHIFPGLHLHPSQLYSSLYGFGLFVLLHFLLQRRRFTGQIVAVLFIVEGLFRFLIENVRYYEDAMIFQLAGQTITWNQVISVGLILFGLFLYFGRKKATANEVLPA